MSIGFGWSAGAATLFPNSISGLFRWYDAADESSVTHLGYGIGSSVLTWADKSGNGATLTSSTGCYFEYFQNLRNGLNGMVVNGPPQFMVNNATTIYGADYTILTASLSIVDDYGDLVGSGDITSGNYLFMNEYGSRLRAHNFMAGGYSVDSNTFCPPGIPRISGQRMNNTGLSVLLGYQLDNTQFTSGIFGTPSNTLTIASRYGGTGPANFTGYIYEILIYNRSLLISERRALCQYLGTKWDIVY